MSGDASRSVVCARKPWSVVGHCGYPATTTSLLCTSSVGRWHWRSIASRSKGERTSDVRWARCYEVETFPAKTSFPCPAILVGRGGVDSIPLRSWLPVSLRNETGSAASKHDRPSAHFRGPSVGPTYEVSFGCKDRCETETFSSSMMSSRPEPPPRSWRASFAPRA